MTIAHTLLVCRRTALRLGAAAGLATLGAGPAASSELARRFAAPASGSRETVDHAPWTQLLMAFVQNGSDGIARVDYRSWKARGQVALKDYVTRLEAVRVGALDRPEQFAYWANLYNAKTIDIVLGHYPVGSIRDISLGDGVLDFLKKSVGAAGPWSTPVVSVSGTRLSLDNIEHDILRPVFRDPRVHYAVNCASIGCPNLQREAFTGATLETQLDAGASAYVNHPRGVSADGGRVTASSIYKWFQVDFGGSDAGVLAHAQRHAAPTLARKLAQATAIDSYDYDWTLNDIAG